MPFRREWPSLIALVLLYAFLAVKAPQFYAPQNLRDLAVTNFTVLLVAGGMTLVIVIAEIDISVGSLFAVVSVCCGLLVKAGLPVPALPAAALIIGAGLGALNGALISFVRIPSIVVTLATMVAWREALRWITGGAWVEGLPSEFQWLGLAQGRGQLVIVLIALAVFGFLWWASEHLSAGRMIFATGSNKEAARLSGLPTVETTFSVFVLLGALTGLASFLNAIRFSDVPASSGNGLELKAIAAVVVGGTFITGGRGSLPGTFIGVILLGSIGPALTYLGVNPFWEKAIQGAIILVTVLFDAALRQHKKRIAAV
ncbi:MAG: ABC transporter permease [Bryobacteraceae bacterium]